MKADDECPNCKSGTLEQNDKDLVCRGECGATFSEDYQEGRKAGQADMYEMLRESKLALTDGVPDKALRFLLQEIEEVFPADGNEIGHKKPVADVRGRILDSLAFRGDPNADYANPDGSVRAPRITFVTCVICAGIAGHCKHTRAPVTEKEE